MAACTRALVMILCSPSRHKEYLRKDRHCIYRGRCWHVIEAHFAGPKVTANAKRQVYVGRRGGLAVTPECRLVRSYCAWHCRALALYRVVQGLRYRGESLCFLRLPSVC